MMPTMFLVKGERGSVVGSWDGVRAIQAIGTTSSNAHFWGLLVPSTAVDHVMVEDTELLLLLLVLFLQTPIGNFLL